MSTIQPAELLNVGLFVWSAGNAPLLLNFQHSFVSTYTRGEASAKGPLDLIVKSRGKGIASRQSLGLSVLVPTEATSRLLNGPSALVGRFSSTRTKVSALRGQQRREVLGSFFVGLTHFFEAN